jgi:hypothetical protein
MEYDLHGESAELVRLHYRTFGHRLRYSFRLSIHFNMAWVAGTGLWGRSSFAPVKE